MRAIIFFVIIALCSLSHSMNAFSQEQVEWNDIFSDITPCSIDATIFMGGKNHNVEKIATIYIELPDSKHMFQQTWITEPLPISFISFSIGELSIVHDYYTDKITSLPEKLLPLYAFSMDIDNDNFFNSIRFPNDSLDINFANKNIELHVSTPELRISPGIFIEHVTGYIWVNGESMKPTKIVLAGSVETGPGEKSSVNMMIDFHYEGFSVSQSDWKAIDAAASSFSKKQKVVDAIIRAIEIASGRFPSPLPGINK